MAGVTGASGAVEKPKAKPRWKDFGGARPVRAGALNQVEFVSSRLGWAAGSEGNGYALALWRFEGGKWTRVKNPWSFAPAAMAAAGPKKAWITGVDLRSSIALFYNGKSWKRTAFPGPGLPVDLAAAPDGTAVSVAGDPFNGRFAVHTWKNGRWARANVPLPPGAVVSTVAAGSRKDVWIGGTQPAGNGLFGSLLLHWNGRAWRQIPIAGTSDKARGINKIVIDAPGRMWALRGSTETTLVRWNGKRVSEAPLPNKGGALTLATDGAGGVWLLPYSSSKATAAPYLHWTKGRWAAPAWGPRRTGVPGLGDIERVPGTRILVSVGGLALNKRKVPLVEIYR
ncbi:hypothetical protein GCM10010468_49000 [Actinocorallia longicatena]|uniref:Uncharacterized protein n=1 Tax=Actinocorallia longicatena TaxID=111803 RepID=A0ABP6QF18_9ACTN